MRGDGSRRGWLLAVTVLVAAGACGGPTNSRSAATATPPAGTGSVSPSAPASPRVVDNLFGWRVVLPKVKDKEMFPVTDGRYLATSITPTSTTIHVVDQQTGRVVFRHTPGEGWYVDDVLLSPPWAIVKEDNSDTEGVTVRLSQGYRYSLLDGSRADLQAQTGMPAPGPADWWFADEGRLAYLAWNKTRHDCLAVADIDTLTGASVYCAATGSYLGFPRMDGRDLTISELDPKAHCRKILWIRAGEPPREAPAQQDCAPFDGAFTGASYAWTEQPPGASAQVAAFYLRDHSGVRPTGAVDAGSLRPCRGWIYWQESGTWATEIKRWKAGHDIEVIYRSPQLDLKLTTMITCQPDTIAVQRFYSGTGEKYDQLLIAALPDG
jgi:hypothetical protein